MGAVYEKVVVQSTHHRGEFTAPPATVMSTGVKPLALQRQRRDGIA